VGFKTGIGRVVLARGNHKGIRGAIYFEQAEDVVKINGVVDMKT
jgi:hypothetical protein